MRPQDVQNLFNHFTYRKTSDEVIAQAKKKAAEIRGRREARIAKLAKTKEEYGIDDAAMNEIHVQVRAADQRATSMMIYNSSKVASNGAVIKEQAQIGVGVVNMILTEQDFVNAEGGQIDKLEMVARNLRDWTDENGQLRGPDLTFEELRFLGF